MNSLSNKILTNSSITYLAFTLLPPGFELLPIILEFIDESIDGDLDGIIDVVVVGIVCASIEFELHCWNSCKTSICL